MLKRKPKKGFVYLLKNKSGNDDTVYKFGCTTVNPDARCKKVNSDNKKYGYEFKVIAAFKSFDIFTDEHKIRCGILFCGAGMLSEIFSRDMDDDLECDYDVINRFLKLGGVIR
jgi:hypothetical protein